VAGRVQHRQQERWAAEEQLQNTQQPAPEAAPGEADYTTELEKLAKLRDQGVISPDDFEAKKKQLLGI